MWGKLWKNCGIGGVCHQGGKDVLNPHEMELREGGSEEFRFGRRKEKVEKTTWEKKLGT